MIQCTEEQKIIDYLTEKGFASSENRMRKEQMHHQKFNPKGKQQ